MHTYIQTHTHTRTCSRYAFLAAIKRNLLQIAAQEAREAGALQIASPTSNSSSNAASHIPWPETPASKVTVAHQAGESGCRYNCR